ncbi:g3174 [Coccomyxa elongata]
MAVFTAHSYLHLQLPSMPFLIYSSPAISGHHSNAPGTDKMLKIKSLAPNPGTTVPELARSVGRYTDKIISLADKGDSQLKSAILALEIKHPAMLKSHADEPAPCLSGVWNSRIADAGRRSAPVTDEDMQVPQTSSDDLASLICQLWEFTCRVGSIYAGVISGELFYLAKLEGSELLISPALHWFSSTPTVLLGSIPTLGDDDKDLQVAKPLTATDTSDKTYSPGETSRKRKRGKPASSLGVTGRPAWDITLCDVPVDSLHIEKVTAQGACGNVAEGRIHNTRVAIKIAPLASSRGPMLVKEAGALLQLRPLWDRYVVGLVDYGTLMDDQHPPRRSALREYPSP